MRFSSYGGYSNYHVFYGDLNNEVTSLTYATVPQNFSFVGLLKFFIVNVNFSLILPFIGIIIFIVYMVKKYQIRNKYLATKDQADKDVYTVRRRNAQWVYDHILFPWINIFNMITFFCTIMYLQSSVVS